MFFFSLQKCGRLVVGDEYVYLFDVLSSFFSNDVTFCLRFVLHGRDLVLFCVVVFSKAF